METLNLGSIVNYSASDLSLGMVQVSYELVTLNGQIAQVDGADIFSLIAKDGRSGGLNRALASGINAYGFRDKVDDLEGSLRNLHTGGAELMLEGGDGVVSLLELGYTGLEELGYAGLSSTGVGLPVAGTDLVDNTGELIFGSLHLMMQGGEIARLGWSVGLEYSDVQRGVNLALYEFDALSREGRALVVDYSE